MSPKSKVQSPKHIVIDARIRQASTGKPVERLLEYLQSLHSDYRFTVLVEPNDTWSSKLSNFSVVPCQFRQFSFNPLQQLAFSWQLYQLKPDLVHFTQTGQQPLLYFGRQITMTHDLTMYEYVRAGGLPPLLHRLRMLGYRLLVWSAHRKAKQIIVPTQYVRQHLAKFHPFTAHKITVTLEASEPPLPLSEQKPNLDINNFILCVGTAFPHKNLEGVVDAFEQLHAQDPTLQLVMAGKKEKYYQALEEYVANKSYAQQIITPGFVSDAELKWLYQHARAYVFPSFSEGFGLPGLEAMAHGCPVVSSNATCLPEVYGKAAMYFDPKNTQDMAHQIQKVISNDVLRSKLIALGSEQIKKYSWHRMSEQTLGIYNDVLGNKPPIN